jgi:hypothetical protein
MIAEPPEQTFTDDYDRMVVELMKIAEEKPTLRMINSTEIKPIEEWKEMYPELWLLIEVTREDIHQIYEGKLIATAENSIEFLEIKNDLRRKKVVNLTTRGVFLGPQPVVVPTFVVLDANNQPLSER